MGSTRLRLYACQISANSKATGGKKRLFAFLFAYSLDLIFSLGLERE
jgi:hypothetical protein